jgi:hypothetical protein
MVDLVVVLDVEVADAAILGFTMVMVSIAQVKILASTAIEEMVEGSKGPRERRDSITEVR